MMDKELQKNVASQANTNGLMTVKWEDTGFDTDKTFLD